MHYTINTSKRTFEHPDYPGVKVVYRPLTNPEYNEIIKPAIRKARKRLGPAVELSKEEFFKTLDQAAASFLAEEDIKNLKENYDALIERFGDMDLDGFIGNEDIEVMAPAIQEVQGVVFENGKPPTGKDLFLYFDSAFVSRFYSAILSDARVTKEQEKNSEPASATS